MSTTTTAGVALALYAVFGVLGFGWRSWLQHRRTGSAGFRGVSGRVGSHTGLFGLVRNAISTAMFIFVAGICLLTPNLVAFAAFILLVAAIELHLRRVEEPYLLRTHGDAYRAYTVGRFINGVGRIR
jgi:protein-S-isoprenylcysteine O-methyltransferase Ste14